jgi:protein-S-isoprenylcysteine O-methyltransferase Ste14
MTVGPAGRTIYLAYGIVAYAAFLAAIGYLVCFVGDFLVPKTINRPVAEHGSVIHAVLIDGALVTIFAVQHSGMARRGFKGVLLRVIPEAAERSTFVLATACVFALMFWLWIPITAVVWSFESPAVSLLTTVLFWLGWAIALLSTFQINHSDLFGLRQARIAYRGHRYSQLPFATSGFYRFVRHPINTGFLLAIWSTSELTTGHLLLAGSLTVYILAATVLEERDLIRIHGGTYLAYRRRVPMLIPYRRGLSSDENLTQKQPGRR